MMEDFSTWLLELVRNWFIWLGEKLGDYIKIFFGFIRDAALPLLENTVDALNLDQFATMMVTYKSEIQYIFDASAVVVPWEVIAFCFSALGISYGVLISYRAIFALRNFFLP
jgi:hypothetical protein